MHRRHSNPSASLDAANFVATRRKFDSTLTSAPLQDSRQKFVPPKYKLCPFSLPSYAPHTPAFAAFLRAGLHAKRVSRHTPLAPHMNGSAGSEGTRSLKQDISDVTDDHSASSCDTDVSRKGHVRRSSKGKWTTEEVRAAPPDLLLVPPLTCTTHRTKPSGAQSWTTRQRTGRR